VLPLPFIGRAFAPLGATRTLGVRLLQAPAAADIQVTVTSSDPNVATVLSPATIRAGESVAELHITTGSAGSATLTLEAPGLRFEFNVVVGSDPTPGSTPLIVAPVVGVTVIPNAALGQVIVSPAAPAAPTLGVRLFAAAATSEVQVTVTSSNPSIATIGGSTTLTMTAAAGQQVLEVPVVTAGAVGTTVLTFEFEGQRRELLIVVGDPPANQRPALTAPIVGVEVRQ
jgi:hypothetical protein